MVEPTPQESSDCVFAEPVRELIVCRFRPECGTGPSAQRTSDHRQPNWNKQSDTHAHAIRTKGESGLPNGLAMSRKRRGPSPLCATKTRRADCRLHCLVRRFIGNPARWKEVFLRDRFTAQALAECNPLFRGGSLQQGHRLKVRAYRTAVCFAMAGLRVSINVPCQRHE